MKEKYGEAALRVTSPAAVPAAAPRRRAIAAIPSPPTSTTPRRPANSRKKLVLASLGCGNPTALAQLNPGETVLDLGSGGGIDVLLSARRVGPTGKAYGLDMTDEMLALANENKRKAGRRERRVPEGRDRKHPAARQLRRRHHLQLRHQPVRRQRPRPARSLPRPEARRPLRRLRCRDPRRDARRDPPERAALGRLRRRRARRERVSRASWRPPASSRSTSSPPASTASKTPANSLPGKDIDVDAIAPQVDGKFMSAFVRAVKPSRAESRTETEKDKPCCGPTCCN